jgi:hypothetical protein
VRGSVMRRSTLSKDSREEVTPPRQRPSSFSVDQVMQKLEESTVGSGR